MMVEAGAVAQPMAPNSSANGTDRRNTKIIVSVTATAAHSASASVTASTFPPERFRSAIRKYRPAENAI